MYRKTFYEQISSIAHQRAHAVFCIERKRFRRREWSYYDLMREVDRVSLLLLHQNLKKGDMVGICAPNSPWWLAVYIACSRLGLPLVPIDSNATEEFIHAVADKTDMKILFKSIYKPVAKMKMHIIEIERLIEYELGDVHAYTFPEVHGSDILEVVFTSGSTGDPKGVILTHENVLSNAQALLKVWRIGDRHRMLSMIPLSHMFEQTVGFLVPFIAGSQVVYVQSVRPFQILQALKADHITAIITVPGFLSLLRRRIVEQAEQHHFDRQLLLELRLARFLPRAVRRYMFQGLLMQFGPSLQIVAVGGAALPPQLESFWESLGISILQGYGLTESSPIATYSAPNRRRRGSVGRSLPSQAVKIADDGEIILSGKNIFRGYFNNAEQTQKVKRDGYLHTGDIGRIDKDGYVYITGRKKNMLLTESGMNIYPEDLEALLGNSTLVRDSVVMLLRQNGKDLVTAVVLSDASKNEIEKVIQAVNKKLASHQIIQKFILWEEADFPRTPTRKIKRQIVIDSVQKAVHNRDNGSRTKVAAAGSQLSYIIAGVVGSTSSRFQSSSKLVSDLQLDSLKRLELVSKIEEELGAYVEESAIDASTTVADLERLVRDGTKLPHARLFSLHVFESEPIITVRVVLGWLLLRLSAVYQSLHTQKLPTFNEPVILVANHTSHFDVLTILKMLSWRSRRKVVIGAAKDYFFKSRVQATLLRLFLPIVPIDREGNVQRTLQELGGYIDHGFSIILFPEGTRSVDGTMLPFKSGVGVIAQELEVPIIPIKLIGNDRIMPKGAHLPKRGRTDARYGSRLVFGRNGNYEETTKTIHDAVAGL